MENQHQQNAPPALPLYQIFGSSIWSGFGEASSFIYQSPTFAIGVRNIKKLTEDVASHMFKPIGLDPNSFTLSAISPELTDPTKYAETICFRHAGILHIEPNVHPYASFLNQFQLSPLSVSVEQHKESFYEGIKNRVFPVLSPQPTPCWCSNDLLKTPEVENVLRLEKLAEVWSVTNKELDLGLMHNVSVNKDDIARKWKSRFDDVPEFFEKISGEMYEEFASDYKMSRRFAKKPFFETFGCNFCAGRNKLIHITNECRVLSQTQKCHQLATGVFCFKCVRPDHRTQYCKKFTEGCRDCQSKHHSEWTHEFMARLQALWEISNQEEALRKCRTEGSDWCDRPFQNSNRYAKIRFVF